MNALLKEQQLAVPCLSCYYVFAGVYAFRQNMRAEKATEHSNPFGKIRI